MCFTSPMIYFPALIKSSTVLFEPESSSLLSPVCWLLGALVAELLPPPLWCMSSSELLLVRVVPLIFVSRTDLPSAMLSELCGCAASDRHIFRFASVQQTLSTSAACALLNCLVMSILGFSKLLFGWRCIRHTCTSYQSVLFQPE